MLRLSASRPLTPTTPAPTFHQQGSDISFGQVLNKSISRTNSLPDMRNERFIAEDTAWKDVSGEQNKENSFGFVLDAEAYFPPRVPDDEVTLVEMMKKFELSSAQEVLTLKNEINTLTSELQNAIDSKKLLSSLKQGEIDKLKEQLDKHQAMEATQSTMPKETLQNEAIRNSIETLIENKQTEKRLEMEAKDVEISKMRERVNLLNLNMKRAEQRVSKLEAEKNERIASGRVRAQERNDIIRKAG